VDPGFVEAKVRLLQIDLWRNEGDPAAEALKLAEAHPHDFAAQRFCGELLLEKGDPAGALGPFERAAGLRPRDMAVRARLAQAYQLNRQYDDAVATIEEVLRQMPDNLDHRASYGLYLGLAKKYDRGLAELKKVIDTPGYKGANAHINRAWIYTNGQPQRLSLAVQSYSKALELEPKNPQAALGLGRAHMHSRKCADAERALETARRLEPKLAGETYVVSAQCHLYLGAETENKNEFERARTAALAAQKAVAAGDPRPERILKLVDDTLKRGKKLVLPKSTAPESECPDLAVLVAKANSGPETARVAAIRTMACAGAEAVKYLHSYLGDPSLAIKTAAIKALTSVGGPAREACTQIQRQLAESNERVLLPKVKLSAEDEMRQMAREKELQVAAQTAIKRICGR
jgi:tetratricopeptide (TPR) repeat protein